MTKITEGAFSNCKNLESVIIGNGVESTEQHAFGNCTSLTNVTIPASMKHLKSLTFYNCSSLTSIIFQGTKSQWDAIIKDYNWDGNTGNYTIHCTDGSFAK